MGDYVINHLGLSCRDPIALERWYAKHFGFTRKRVFLPGPDQVVVIGNGGVSLELFPAKGERPAAPEGDGAGPEYPGFRHLAFLVDDLDAKLFTFSDTIAGAVTGFDPDSDSFGLQTADGREFDVTLTDTTYGELLRNLGEPYVDATGQMRDMLAPGRFLFAYGVFYPEGEWHSFEAKHLVFVGRTPFDYMFEQPDWWITQVRSLAEFYLRAQFGEGEVDYRNYRTVLTLEGYKPSTHRQETDTISRLVYGFATAYLLTGEDRFLNAAERGVEYLRDHMRIVDLAQ